MQQSATRALDATPSRPVATKTAAPRGLGNQAVLRRLQPKLRVGAIDDPMEREADAAADAVMAGGPPPSLAPAPSAVSRKCEACEEDETVQRDAFAPAPDAAPASVESVLGSPGRPLDPASRQFFGERFGQDFGAVRVHDDAAAARSAAEVNARAYTVGSHVVFGAGEHAPATPEGAHLMAHELAHVVQQDGATVRRVAPAVAYGAAAAGGAALGLAAGASWDLYQLSQIGDRPTGGAAAAFSSPGCPANYCTPFNDPAQARLDWDDARPRFYRLLTAWFGGRVWPLWDVYLHGGSARRDISADFGPDFTAASGTANSAEALRGALARDVIANHATLMGGGTRAAVDFTPRLPTLQTSLNTRGDPAQLRFPADFRSIPGSFAGGVDVQQTTNNTGSPIDPATGRPRPGQADMRAFTMSATLVRQSPSQIEVTPSINFVVQDTIDFCPGNCGGSLIQNVTVPMSRFEASGMAGDVPFVVNFPAPAEKQSPFTVQTGGTP